MSGDKMAIEWTAAQHLQRFYHDLDARNYEGCAACFFEDGYWNRMGEDLNGLPAIREALTSRNPKLAIRHVLSNVHPCEATETSVRVLSYVSVFLHLFEGEPVVPAPLREPKSIWALDTRIVWREERWGILSHDGELVMTRA